MTDEPPLTVSPGPSLPIATALTLGIHAAPGTYALLLGSGISRGAGIPTGYEVMQLLLAKAATATLNDADELAAARANLDSWWLGTVGTPATYSDVLEKVGPTPAARRTVLAGFFEADESGAPRRPTPAHQTIARMVLTGRVRLIFTTNFDRLTETALTDAGVAHQVVARPADLAAAVPLVHGMATVVKLHGDWTHLDQLNTSAELGEYDPTWSDFVTRTLPDFGLVAVGWSGESDTALVDAVEGAAPRRYPRYFMSRGSLRGASQRLVSTAGFHVVEATGADEFFADLDDRLDALEAMADLPISRSMTVARLKSLLPEPTKRIALREMVFDELGRVVDRINDEARHPLGNPPPGENLQQHISGAIEDARILGHLLAHGIRVGGPDHDDLWVEVFQRLLDEVGAVITGNSYWIDLRRITPLYLLYLAGTSAVMARRPDLLARLMLEPTFHHHQGSNYDQPFLFFTYSGNIVARDQLFTIPRFTRSRPHSPLDLLLLEELTMDLRGFGGAAEIRRSYEQFGYWRSLIGLSLPEPFSLCDLGQWCSSYFEHTRGYLTAHTEAERLAQPNPPSPSVRNGGAFQHLNDDQLRGLIVKLDGYGQERIRQ